MSPTLALFLWLVLLLGLLRFDPAKVPGNSASLWVPVMWIFFVGSRLPSQWLGLQGGMSYKAFEEGNPLDRTVDLILIGLAATILVSRSFGWTDFFKKNLALTAFLAFGLLSVCWSDFQLIATKRWFRDLGNYLAILVVLSDREPLEAVRAVLRRTAYLLIPLCILLNKYFPQLSKQYDQWTGLGMYTGATTSKNMLGALCLMSGIFFFWDAVARWPKRKEKRTKRILLVNVMFLATTLWELNLADSQTSLVCLAIGSMVILMAHSELFRRNPRLLKLLVPSLFVFYLILAFGFDLNGEFAEQLGRNPTLTDRTLIWQAVLNTKTNLLFGTGYESFWLGPRLSQIWRQLPGINEAHNGYLEIYLNLGFIGLFLLIMLLMGSYRKISKNLTSLSSVASLNLAMWTITLFYNITEAGFKSGLMWIVFLLGALVVPSRVEDRAPGIASARLPLRKESFTETCFRDDSKVVVAGNRSFSEMLRPAIRQRRVINGSL